VSETAGLTLSQVAADPACLTQPVTLPSGETAHLRLLQPADGDAFGPFLEGLSEATRTLYAPHPLTDEHGRQLCAEVDYGNLLTRESGEVAATLRFVGLIREEVTAYFILALGVRQGERRRYADVGIALDPADTCTFAPVVADAHQNQGVGSALVPGVFDAARRLGFTRCALMGGTRAINHRAIRFYEKAGFRKVAEFDTQGPDGETIGNQDMLLDL
jgi:GNAT superfamily N-acetyltransferase